MGFTVVKLPKLVEVKVTTCNQFVISLYLLILHTSDISCRLSYDLEISSVISNIRMHTS